jgi:hypothetical protein
MMQRRKEEHRAKALVNKRIALCHPALTHGDWKEGYCHMMDRDKVWHIQLMLSECVCANTLLVLSVQIGTRTAGVLRRMRRMS